MQFFKRWNQWLRPTKVKGVYERRDGGFLVRARSVDQTTGCMVEIFRTMPEATLGGAIDYLERRKQEVVVGNVRTQEQSSKVRFAEYAARLFEEKVAAREIVSAKGREKWASVLAHLIKGTQGVEGFGAIFMDSLRPAHVQRWRLGIATLVAQRHYSPNSANTWLNVLKVVLRAAARDLSIADPTVGVKPFDTSEHATYTEEEPNSLLPAEVPLFLHRMRTEFPQHFAMTYLGLVTGLRPSSLRPLRRRGDEPDVQWERSRLLIRRSHTRRDEVMATTKTKRRYAIDLPTDVLDVLKWHVDTQLITEEQKGSDLLFPSEVGGFRASSVLDKPFAALSEVVGKKLTPRALRRTFQDLARAAHVGDLVTRSISGHATATMQAHYSTVNPEEQRAALAKVVSIASGPTGAAGGPGGDHSGGPWASS